MDNIKPFSPQCPPSPMHISSEFSAEAASSSMSDGGHVIIGRIDHQEWHFGFVGPGKQTLIDQGKTG
jgi:hypothetical protein